MNRKITQQILAPQQGGRLATMPSADLCLTTNKIAPAGRTQSQATDAKSTRNGAAKVIYQE